MEEKIIDLTKVSKESIQIIGAELKRRRVNQSRTLINLSSVCSVSYISKIENGKIIPKLHVLRELCEEQGISKEELDTLLMVDSLIQKCIESLFWNNYKKIAEIYSSVCSFDNYKVNFIKTIYEMTYYHWNTVEELLNSLYIIKNNINGNDYYIYNYLLMCYENAMCNYPKVYHLYTKMKHCKDNYVIALAAKEMFIAEAKYGLECPVLTYEEYNKKYVALFNYNNESMHNLLIESLVKANYEIPDTLKKELKPSLRLQYCLVSGDFLELDDLLQNYTPSQYEKLLIATAKNDYCLGEKIYKKLQLHKLSANDAIIANYCNYINKGEYEELANYIIQVAAPFALKENNGIMYKMFLEKLSSIAFAVGKYKAVATMNLKFFEMQSKCRKCMF